MPLFGSGTYLILAQFLPGGTNIFHGDINESVFNENAALVEEVLHHLKEAGVLSLRNMTETFRDLERTLNHRRTVELKKGLLNLKKNIFYIFWIYTW